MKTDAEVLDGAIAILEQEGHWCQQEFYQTDEAGTVLSYCAEGALLEAAGFWEVATAEKNHFDGLRDGWRTRASDVILAMKKARTTLEDS